MSALGGFVMLGAGGCSPRILEASEVLVLLTPYFLFHHISSKLKRRGAGLFEREREREREHVDVCEAICLHVCPVHGYSYVWMFL